MSFLRRRGVISAGGVFLYDFTAFTFTNGTQTGATGPSRANLLAAYDTSTFEWLENEEFFNVQDGIQMWTVPEDGEYKITVHGAGNPDRGRGSAVGAIVQGNFELLRGDTYKIAVGQIGANNGDSGGGGGGSFFVDSSDHPMLIAGGSGGHTGNAVIGTAGGNNTNYGNGGPAEADCAGGAGFLSNGSSSGSMNGGHSFLNGLQGGGNQQSGGFGGGGDGRTQCCRNGGGGGYTGGSGHTSNAGGFGGGCFIVEYAIAPATSNGNWSTNGNEPHNVYQGSVANLGEVSSSHGKVIITRL